MFTGTCQIVNILKKMEVSRETRREIELDRLHGGGEESIFQIPELESPGSGTHFSLGFDQHLRSMNALEILIETLRILRYNGSVFLMISSVLICPVSAVLLSNVLVDQAIVRRLTIRLLLVAKSSGLPLKAVVRQSCQHFSEMVVSTISCFPLYITLLLLSKAAIVFAVDCNYSKRKVNACNFLVIIGKIWRRIFSTYLCNCVVIVGCLALFLVLLMAVCNMFSLVGLPSHLIVCPVILVGFAFSIFYAVAVIIGNIAIVISGLEDTSGPQALLHSDFLVRGQTQVGLLIYLGSTIGMAFVEGLFEHRVKILSYGDGLSRTWEGPLLVILYSFVVLIDCMMSAVFYFTCRSNIETDEQYRTLEASTVLFSESMEVQ